MGRRIVLTGVSRGLGRAMTDGFVAAGHVVIGCARSAEAVAELSSRYPGIIHTDMLDSCFGDGASSYPSPSQWARRAVPLILRLGARDNGRMLSCE